MLCGRVCLSTGSQPRGDIAILAVHSPASRQTSRIVDNYIIRKVRERGGVGGINRIPHLFTYRREMDDLL